MGISFWQVLVVLILIVMLFGRGRISDLMGDVAKGIKSFKKGLAEDETPEAPPPEVSSREIPDGPAGDTKPAPDAKTTDQSPRQ